MPPGMLAGRRSGFGLTASGRQQIERLIPVVSRLKIERIYASPLERTQQSAALLAEPLRLPVETADQLNELDYGDWTGKSFEELDKTPEWARYNEFRSGTRIPAGELMLQTQARVKRELEAAETAWLAATERLETEIAAG